MSWRCIFCQSHKQAKSLRFRNDASAVVFSHSCCAFKNASALMGENGELSCAKEWVNFIHFHFYLANSISKVLPKCTSHYHLISTKTMGAKWINMVHQTKTSRPIHNWISVIARWGGGCGVKGVGITSAANDSNTGSCTICRPLHPKVGKIYTFIVYIHCIFFKKKWQDIVNQLMHTSVCKYVMQYICGISLKRNTIFLRVYILRAPSSLPVSALGPQTWTFLSDVDIHQLWILFVSSTFM